MPSMMHAPCAHHARILHIQRLVSGLCTTHAGTVIQFITPASDSISQEFHQSVMATPSHFHSNPSLQRVSPLMMYVLSCVCAGACVCMGGNILFTVCYRCAMSTVLLVPLCCVY